jgi:hypothetical protein
VISFKVKLILGIILGFVLMFWVYPMMSFSEIKEFSDATVITIDSTSIESFSDNTKVISSSATSVYYALPIGETITKDSKEWNNKIPDSINAYRKYRIDVSTIQHRAENNQKMSISLDDNQYDFQLEPINLRAPDAWTRLTTTDGYIDVPAPQAKTFKGKIIKHEKTSDISITISGDWMSGYIKMDHDGYQIEKLDNYDPESAKTDFIIYKESDTFRPQISNDVLKQNEPPNLLKSNEGISYFIKFSLFQYADAVVVNDAKIILDCDKQYFELDPPVNWADRQLAVLNNIRPVYEPLGINFVVVGQICDFTNIFLTSTNNELLLDQVAGRWNTTQTQRHTVHLLTGKNLDGSMFGVANLGGLSSPLHNSYSLSQQSPDILNGFLATDDHRKWIMAHELGHIFSATHEAQGKCVFVSDICFPRNTIMVAGLTASFPLFEFSDGSLGPSNNNEAAILNFASSNLVNPDPIPCLTSSTGDWFLGDNCTLQINSVLSGNVIVQSNSVLTIPNGKTLDIDFANKYLLIKSGSSIIIKQGGKIT